MEGRAGSSGLRRDKPVSSTQAPQPRPAWGSPLFQEVLSAKAGDTGQEGSPERVGGSVLSHCGCVSTAEHQLRAMLETLRERQTPLLSVAYSPAGWQIKTDWGGEGFSQERLPGGRRCLGRVLKHQ